MKISSQSFASISAAIEPLDTPELRAQYRDRRIPRGELVKDIDKRYRWDLVRMARVDICALYDAEGLHDPHIDTALRRIVPPLN